MISAWARMCKIFGTEFTQYLPLVMPSVMKAASIKPEVAVIDGLSRISLFSMQKIIILLRLFKGIRSYCIINFMKLELFKPFG